MAERCMTDKRDVYRDGVLFRGKQLYIAELFEKQTEGEICKGITLCTLVNDNTYFDEKTGRCFEYKEKNDNDVEYGVTYIGRLHHHFPSTVARLIFLEEGLMGALEEVNKYYIEHGSFDDLVGANHTAGSCLTKRRN